MLLRDKHCTTASNGLTHHTSPTVILQAVRVQVNTITTGQLSSFIEVALGVLRLDPTSVIWINRLHETSNGQCEDNFSWVLHVILSGFISLRWEYRIILSYVDVNEFRRLCSDQRGTNARTSLYTQIGILYNIIDGILLRIIFNADIV